MNPARIPVETRVLPTAVPRRIPGTVRVRLTKLRPLSGSGTLGIFTELVKQFGADSLLARTAGSIYGSTETTFYVLAVYFGAVGIKKTRHALPACLTADVAGISAAVFVVWWMFG